MDYSGKIITKNAVTPTQTAASGVWTLDDALQAQKGNNWPIAGVPNPISKSLRFNSSDSAYLNRTPTIQGNRRTWTWSGWVKRGALGSSGIFQGYFNTVNLTALSFDTDALRLQDYSGASYNLLWTTSAVFRDPSAWYHIVLVYDTTQASSANAVKMYVNGTQQTLTFTAVGGSYAQNREGLVNNINSQQIGNYYTGTYFNGYMTEINFVDGQALTPSDFGMTDTNTGVWIPKKYTGTYGTNGFYLNFKDATNTSTLGLDYSGNGNNWNANNFSVTAGAGNDSMTDVPTPWVGYSVNGDTGGVVRGNYCTLNPLNEYQPTTLTNGNLDAANNGSGGRAMGTIGVTSGKWYYEVLVGPMAGSNDAVARASSSVYGYSFIYRNGGDTVGLTGSPTLATYAQNDIIGIALDVDNEQVTFYKNGVLTGTGAYSYLATKPAPIHPMLFIPNSGTSATFNFGQRPFAYTPPAGFLSLCTTNLPTPTIGATSTTQADNYFNITLWTGNSSSPNTTRNITGIEFQPDFVWVKMRSGPGYNHNLYDAVRGAGSTKNLISNNTDIEGLNNNAGKYGYVSSFNSDGYTLTNGTDASIPGAWVNQNNETFVGWSWKANGAGSSNTAGSITSTVSANTTAGFSIVTYTGTGANATIGHGLGVAPAMVITKCRTSNFLNYGIVYHKSLGATKGLYLSLTDAAGTVSTYWNDTAPTSTVFSVGSYAGTNSGLENFVAYCFAEVAGYSAFGSYTGNGSADGPFIYTGFRPRYLMLKVSSGTTDSWVLLDSARNTYNVTNSSLFANVSNAESTGSGGNVDFLSNGFKLRTADAGRNGNTYTYIYAAFAESPFKFANAR